MIQPKILQTLKRDAEIRSMGALRVELKELMHKHPMETTVQDLIDVLESRKDVHGTLNEYGTDFALNSVFFNFHMHGLDL